MQTDILTIQTEAMPTHTRLKLDGEIDAGTSRALDTKFSQLLVDYDGPVVVDMNEVQYISSAGIGIFIYFFGELNKVGRKLLLYRPTAVVNEILTLLRLEEHIPIVENEESLEQQLAA